MGLILHNTDYQPFAKKQGVKMMLRFGDFCATFGYFLATFWQLVVTFGLLYVTKFSATTQN